MREYSYGVDINREFHEPIVKSKPWEVRDPILYDDLSDISGVLKSSHWSQRSMFAKVIPEILTERKFQITTVAPSSTVR